MQRHHIQRFIGMATPSVLDPRDRRTLQPRVSTLLARTFLPRAYDEIVAMSKIIMSSDRTWTIIRFLAPRDGARNNAFEVASSAPTNRLDHHPGRHRPLLHRSAPRPALPQRRTSDQQLSNQPSGHHGTVRPSTPGRRLNR